jgi:SAM-dependent methyltransferase
MLKSINWDHLLPANPRDALENHWTQMTWTTFARYFPDKGLFLEVGCSSGRLSILANQITGAISVGLDISHSALQYAQTLAELPDIPSPSFVQGSGFALPFRDSTFDVVFSEGVIEHFPQLDTELMVREHVRVCRPGGRVIISVPNLLNLPLTYHKLRTGKNYLAYPERSYTRWGLRRLLRRCGVASIAWDGFAPTVGLEWFIHKSLHWPGFDRWVGRFPWLASLVGYECLVVGEKL